MSRASETPAAGPPAPDPPQSPGPPGAAPTPGNGRTVAQEAVPFEEITGSLPATATAPAVYVVASARDLPPGRTPPTAAPYVRELPAWECWARIAVGGVGRVAVTTPDGPQVLPVNYRSFEGSVVYRTTGGGLLDGSGAPVVAFEVDRLDESPGGGWSVQLLGTARPVTDPAAVARLRRHADPRPWVGGHRERWVRVVPHRISGREIRSDGRSANRAGTADRD